MKVLLPNEMIVTYIVLWLFCSLPLRTRGNLLLARVFLVWASTVQWNHLFPSDGTLTNRTGRSHRLCLKPLVQAGPTGVWTIETSNCKQMRQRTVGELTRKDDHTCWPLHPWQCPGKCCTQSLTLHLLLLLLLRRLEWPMRWMARFCGPHCPSEWPHLCFARSWSSTEGSGELPKSRVAQLNSCCCSLL